MFNIFHWQHLLHGPYTDEFTGCCNSTEYKSKIFREASETNHQKYIRRGNLNILSLAHVNINSIRKHFESVAEDKSSNFDLLMWRLGVAVITTAQLHSTKPELRFCAGSNPARGMSEIRDGEDLWQWSRLETRLNAFRRSTIPQKQFIIIIIIIIWNKNWL